MSPRERILPLVVGLAVAGLAVAQDRFELRSGLQEHDRFAVTVFFENDSRVDIDPDEEAWRGGPSLARLEQKRGEEVLEVRDGVRRRVRQFIASEKGTRQGPKDMDARTGAGMNDGRIFVIDGYGEERGVDCLNDSASEEAKGQVRIVPFELLLPREPVAVGQEWRLGPSASIWFVPEMGDVEVDRAEVFCLLLGVETTDAGRIARIQVRLDVRAHRGEEMKQEMLLKGEARFDLGSGRFCGWDLQGEAHAEGTGVADSGGELEITISGRVTWRETWTLGEADLGDESKRLPERRTDEE